MKRSYFHLRDLVTECDAIPTKASLAMFVFVESGMNSPWESFH